jgi:signal transduction histidine kinase
MRKTAPLAAQSLRPVPAAPPRPQPSVDEAKRAFMRTVSHELRTPLNAIIGFSEILGQELYGPLGAPQYREYAGIIHESGTKLLHLINQVLEIAKLEGGGVDMDLRLEPLDAVVEDATRVVAEDVGRRGLTLKVDLPERAPAALADARAVRTAVSNLLQNAAAHAPEGGEVRLCVRAQGALVQIAVENDGEGVDPEQLPRLMRPFEQGDGTLGRKHEGAGLGWPIVRLLCEAMGGSFEVLSAPGEGVRAVMTLRRAG